MLSTEIDPRNCFSNWMRAVDNKFVLGNFTWTAMDYLGEVASGWYHFADRPSSLFPWHSSYTGDFDLCGFRKPRSFYRDILFDTNKKLSIFVHAPVSSFDGKGHSLWGWDDVKPSWTWPNFENKTLTVDVYSACDSVELFLNSKSLGVEKTSRATEFKAKWQVPYRSGTLSAVGYIKGEKTEKCELVTAGKPYQIKLTADRQTIKADKQDLSYITVEVADENGIVVPYADHLIDFKITGEGSLAGVGNSNPRSVESFQLPHRKAFEGRCLVIIRSKDQSNKQIILHASSKGLKSDKIIITTL